MSSGAMVLDRAGLALGPSHRFARRHDDNLNRATSIGGVACTNDILGNRLTKGTASYTWDALNRLTSYNNGTLTTNYVYRADGMRVSKSNSSGSTNYYYDGQMCMQDVETPTSGSATITNYALGARGIDGISVTQNGTTNVGYPIYDAHGNRVASLTKHYSGQNVTGWDLSDVRTYDAWGNITNTNTSGRPRARYCANLGHVQDDESGLVYMRARYYEPTSGRFISEDEARDGSNWLAYCRNNPVDFSDVTGKSSLWENPSQIIALAKTLCRELGFGEWQAPRIVDIVAAYFEKIVFLYGLEAAGSQVAEIGIVGIGGSGVFMNPFTAGLCGAAAVGGLLMMLAANLGAIFATRDLIVDLWLLSAESGD